MKAHTLNSNLKNLNYTFVSNDIFAATALMKCELPARALELLGTDAQHIRVKDFISQSKAGFYNSKSVIVFLKIGNNLEKQTIEEIERARDTVFAMFCDVNDNYHFLIDGIKEEMPYTPASVLKFLKLMDGILYESSDLKEVILKYNKDLNPLRTRHPHTNCSKQLNHFSVIDGSEDPAAQFYKTSESFSHNNIFNFGYLGRPKQCTDFLRLTRSIFNLSGTARFLHSNPNISTNMSLTAEIDLGFSLYDFDDWTRKLKPANKILNYWSIGIPCMMSPYTSYKDVFSENNLDFDYYKIPDLDMSQYEGKSRHEISIAASGELTEKIRNIVSNPPEFHRRRRELWNVSKRYNPMNMEFLYEGMFDCLKEML